MDLLKKPIEGGEKMVELSRSNLWKRWRGGYSQEAAIGLTIPIFTSRYRRVAAPIALERSLANRKVVIYKDTFAYLPLTHYTTRRFVGYSVKFSYPSSVTMMRSSIRTPPVPCSYSPGSTVTM